MDRTPGPNFAAQIKQLRLRLGLTQALLAERLGVSFPTVNRWENGKSAPSQLAWTKLRELAGETDGDRGEASDASHEPPPLDFTARPEAVRALVEGERLSFGHLANPAFATETSNIDPLPHQRIAVYDFMLRQLRQRCDCV